MSKIADLAFSAIEQPVRELGYEVVEVRYGKEYGSSALTVYIDSLTDKGVGLDDCERVSTTIDPILDQVDPTNGAPYNLNVSSAGLDRPIKTERDYKRNLGREVEAKLYAPLAGTKTKIVNGVLESRNGDDIVIRNPNGYKIDLKISQIALLTQWVKFD